MNTHMRRFLLFLGVGSLAFSLACGGGTGGGKGSGGGGGSFSNASLSGQYAYQLKGYFLSNGLPPFREAGVFTADGNGHITSGKDDFASGSTISTDNITGSYQVSGNGIASVVLNFASGGSAAFAITLSSSSQFYAVETDSAISGLVASGTAQKQDTSAFAAVPSGTYVLRMHTLSNTQGSTSTVGAFTVSNGTVTGNMDKNRTSAFTSSTITGVLNFPDATSGRGSGTFTDSVSGPSTFLYYVVDANHLVFFSTDAGIIGTGQAEKQTGAPFSTASFTGPYAFGTSGDAAGLTENTNTAGRFNADGSGAISNGVLDTVTNSTVSNFAFTGTYTMDTNGRAVVTLTPGSGSVQQVYWMVSPTRAFFVTDSASSVEDGSLDAQVGSFSAATLNGTYAFGITGFDGSLTNDLTGTLQGNGTSTLNMILVPNVDGTVPSQTQSFSGTYTVGSNGRAVGSLTNFSNNLIMYMVSPSKAYIVQADSGVQLYGTMTLQP